MGKHAFSTNNKRVLGLIVFRIMGKKCSELNVRFTWLRVKSRPGRNNWYTQSPYYFGSNLCHASRVDYVICTNVGHATNCRKMNLSAASGRGFIPRINPGYVCSPISLNLSRSFLTGENVCLAAKNRSYFNVSCKD